jgi:hypothetical protein
MTDTAIDHDAAFCCGAGEQFLQRAGDVLFAYADAGKGPDHLDELLVALLPLVAQYAGESTATALREFGDDYGPNFGVRRLAYERAAALLVVPHS